MSNSLKFVTTLTEREDPEIHILWLYPIESAYSWEYPRTILIRLDFEKVFIEFTFNRYAPDQYLGKIVSKKIKRTIYLLCENSHRSNMVPEFYHVYYEATNEAAQFLIKKYHLFERRDRFILDNIEEIFEHHKYAYELIKEYTT